MTPPNDERLKTFNRFAGKAVKVTEHTQLRNAKYSRSPTITTYKLDQNDPVIIALTAEAEKAAIALRLWLPGTVGTRDYDTDRLNVTITKDDKGTWRIADRFRFG